MERPIHLISWHCDAVGTRNHSRIPCFPHSICLFKCEQITKFRNERIQNTQKSLPLTTNSFGSIRMKEPWASLLALPIVETMTFSGPQWTVQGKKKERCWIDGQKQMVKDGLNSQICRVYGRLPVCGALTSKAWSSSGSMTLCRRGARLSFTSMTYNLP